MADGSGRLPELSPSPSKGSFAKEQFRGGANVNFGPMPKKRPKELPSHQRSMLGKMVRLSHTPRAQASIAQADGDRCPVCSPRG
jgi:hypothetical protein